MKGDRASDDGAFGNIPLKLGCLKLGCLKLGFLKIGPLKRMIVTKTQRVEGNPAATIVNNCVRLVDVDRTELRKGRRTRT